MSNFLLLFFLILHVFCGLYYRVTKYDWWSQDTSDMLSWNSLISCSCSPELVDTSLQFYERFSSPPTTSIVSM